MTEIAKCQCGSTAGIIYRNPQKSIVAVRCDAGGCWSGPDQSSSKRAIAEWDRLMAGTPETLAEPKPGTVRVRIAIRLDEKGVVSLSSLNWGIPSWKPTAIVTADIPLPQPVEIAGTVEASDG